MDNEEQKYQNALDYLYQFVDYSLTKQDRLAAAKFDLQRMFDLMHLLGDPQKKYPIVHVAGTKGKGSTAAMIASVFQAAGYKTGLYTSPHLQDFCERIKIDGKNISHEKLVELVEQIQPSVAKIEELTTFELTTALGFKAFADAGVEIAVFEVGLGGRLDATNILSPLVSVITSLSYDHMAVLGDTLAQIATEKSGIIKQGRPVVLAPQEDSARKVVETIAKERSAPITIIGEDLHYASLEHSFRGQIIQLWENTDQAKMDDLIESPEKTNWQPVTLKLPLLGYHQVQNAATAYAAIEIARSEGLQISDEAIKEGYDTVECPGRFE
ncbi:MAG: Mur ligase family protein, partial [Anaerolineaceae bacterium]|nr:Mur ligase family protein [Anaerolineaceae bacterium]